MKSLRPTALACAIVLAFGAATPASAQTNAEVLKELAALKARIAELEKKLAAVPEAPADGQQAQWGMTPEQAADFNKLVVKTEALEDAAIVPVTLRARLAPDDNRRMRAITLVIGFAVAYLAAAAAVVVLVGGYAASVLRERRAGLTLGATLAIVYGLLYGLVVSEEYSLLMGALALLAVVAVLMYLTRKVDWYAYAAVAR